MAHRPSEDEDGTLPPERKVTPEYDGDTTPRTRDVWRKPPAPDDFAGGEQESEPQGTRTTRRPRRHEQHGERRRRAHAEEGAGGWSHLDARRAKPARAATRGSTAGTRTKRRSRPSGTESKGTPRARSASARRNKLGNQEDGRGQDRPRSTKAGRHRRRRPVAVRRGRGIENDHT